MEERAVVTVLLRNNGAILLCRRSEAVGSCSGRWAGVAGHVEESPEAAARQEIREKTGLSSESIALVYKGEPFTVEDSDLTIQWTVHPCLFDRGRRARYGRGRSSHRRTPKTKGVGVNTENGVNENQTRVNSASHNTLI